MTTPERRRRRIDRLTADDYLDDIESRSTTELRAMREDCREEEGQLSYTRRLLQGRLDIARAEIARRQSDGDTADLIDLLPKILADQPSPRPRDARNAPLHAPSEHGRRRDDTAVDDSDLSHILDFDDDELRAYLERVTAEERVVSERRRLLLNHIDALQAEVVRRLQSGTVDVDEIVSLSVPAAAGGQDPEAPREGLS